MGLRKISGIVIRKNKDYMYILRDDRIDGGYDILACSNETDMLSEGDCFTFFVTTVSVKESKGIKMYTFANATLKKDDNKRYPLNLSSKEMTLLLFVVQEQLKTMLNKLSVINIRDYSDEKQFMDLAKFQKELQELILKG